MGVTTILSYDGLVTGSTELRKHNEFKYKEGVYDDNKQGQLIDYFKKYDKQKKGEPFFDAFLTAIAFSKEKKTWIPIKYADGNENKGYKSTLKTDVYHESNFELDNDNDKYQKYIGGKHIFMMCPMSKELLDDITEEITKNITGGNDNLYIHIQGEASQSDGECDYTGMTPKEGGGLFGEAFNLYSGGEEMRKFRSFVNDKKIQCYAVKPKPRVPAEEKISFPHKYTENEEDKEEIIEIPQFYESAYNDILLFSSNAAGTPSDIKLQYNKLKVLKVYQDLTDKDNLASLAMIGHLADPSFSISGTKQIELGLVGFRIYSSNSIGFEKVGSPTTFHLPFIFGKINGTDEVFKPADKRNDNGNTKFLTRLTYDFYDSASRGFFDIIDNHCPNKFHQVNLGIVDGMETVSKSLRCPFNMSLYYFPEDTYMELYEYEKDLINPPEQQQQQPPPEQQQQQQPQVPTQLTGGGKSLKKYKTPHRSYNFSKSKSVIRNNTRKKRKSKKPNK